MKVTMGVIITVSLMALAVPAQAAVPQMAAGHADQNASALDRFDIQQLSAKYAWGIDTLDKASLASVFAADATAHYEIVTEGPIKLNDRLAGFDAIYQWLFAHLNRRKGRDALPWHFVTNQIVEVHGDEGSLRFYMHNRPGIAGGVYYMKVRRTAEGWRVTDLHLEEQIWNSAGYGARVQ